MASITIRNLDDDIKQRLRVRFAGSARRSRTART
jgi:plasmid stability protein